MFKDELDFESYLVQLSPGLRRCMSRFRCRNHYLPVESARNVLNDRQFRVCTLCNLQEIGDEYHYVMKCQIFQEYRKMYVKRFYYTRPSSFKFSALMNIASPGLTRLAKFVKIIISQVK